MDEGNTFVNALIGAVVSVVAGAVIPFAPLFGGGVAGYLEGGDRSDGIRVGLISGLIALVPTVLIGFFLFALLGVFAVGAGPGHGGLAFGAFGYLFVVFAFLFGALYVVGLSVAGGWLGNYVKYDTELEL